MSETDPHRTPSTLELLTLLTGGGTAPAGMPAGLPASGRLRPSADRELQLRRRSDLRARLTDGIVELRKRRPWSGPVTRSPEARTPGAEAPW
ncbi:hypothetical protein [Streptomyces sp. NPDC059957]|uniref:hypothetical protein n=1 Tax=unclassified Streptomyces TaxID=2593676 RepID=UPI003666DDC0